MIIGWNMISDQKISTYVLFILCVPPKYVTCPLKGYKAP